MGSIIQALRNSNYNLYNGGTISRIGQRIDSFPVVPITQISFYLRKVGSPTSTAYIRVRAVSDDSIIGTIGTLDVSTLTTSWAWYDFSGSVSVPSSQNIRISIEYYGGGASNRVEFGYWAARVCSGVLTRYLVGSSKWQDESDDSTFKLYWTSVGEAYSQAYIIS